ncbi:conjugal transfer protein (traG) [Helicobacter bizzozeronii CIII-1]|uniref:Conjugal transfer protein (TraG) n=1 Tax=Helicobacter bizzozeronii (strain CIII-1) TaxID=1002804 RepID=F8KPH3_HELBC|nr:type IV secretory system conjugative DNA transfer family protein [Helicobacter bizzozeronii]CCB80697.1 conjugal transfer protein (traG) [Helicobacter bizzozeronii CIII-1]
MSLFLSVLGIPLFFILSNWYAFEELHSFNDAYVFSYSIISGLQRGASLLDLKFEVYIATLLALTPLIATLYIIIPKTSKKTHGYAKWAMAKDIECFKIFSKEGFCKIVHPLGVCFNKGFILGKFGFPLAKRVCYNKPLGAMIVAPPGAGKTAAIAIPNLLTLPTSCIVTDIKGELCSLSAGYRQRVLHNEILVFNPFGEDNTCFFNPFDKRLIEPMSFDAKLRLVQEVANNIFIQEDKQEDHWVAKARELFSFYALYDVCTKNESSFYDIAMWPNRDFAALIHPQSRHYAVFFQEDENGNMVRTDSDIDPAKSFYTQVLEQKYADVNDPRNYDPNEPEPEHRAEGVLDEIIRNDARGWANAAEEEFASIKSTFNRFVSVFKSPQVKEATSNMSFKYADFRKKNITLYIKIAQTDIATLAPLIRTLLESIAKNLLIEESKKPNERIYFILDEFVRFGKLPFLLEMPALCRSYNVVPLFITQDYAMIRKYYSDDELKVLKGVVHYNIVFKMNSAEDAEIISKEVGQFTRLSKNTSTERGQLVFGGTSSYSLEGRELLTPQDILNIPDDEVIVIVTGNKAKPLKLKANFYFKDKELLNRVDWTTKSNKGD